MKKLRNTVVTAAVAMALAPIGMAQDGEREGRGNRDRPDGDQERPERMEGRRPGGNPFVAILDADKNGELSAEEIVLAPAILAKMDKNGDGKLSGEELRPPQRDGEGERDRPDARRPDGDRPKGDRPDGDKPEGGRPDGDRPKGDRADRDKPEGGRPDGDRPKGDRPDGDKPEGGRPDGARPEGGRPDGVRPPGGFGDRLKAMDKNENGNLEAEEIPEQFRDRMMDHLDKNGDSVISKEELNAAAEEMRKRFGKGGDRARPDGDAGKGRGGRDGDAGGAVKPKRPPLEE